MDQQALIIYLSDIGEHADEMGVDALDALREDPKRPFHPPQPTVTERSRAVRGVRSLLRRSGA